MTSHRHLLPTPAVDDLDHDHDRGLAHDLGTIAAQLVDRRRALAFLGSAGSAALVAGCGGGGSDTSTAVTATTSTATTGTTTTTTTATTTTDATATASGTCVADASETAGPYPGDGTNSASGSTSNVLTQSGIVRTDIRPSFLSTTNTAAGVQVTLTLTLVNTNAACAPLSGYAIYLWHCDRAGQYSLYTVPAESYLRGVQVTNSAGQVTFTTIFPGCYDGRFPHIHLEVFTSLSAATSGRAAALTTQIYPPRDVCSTVYSGASGYTASVTNLARVTLQSDGVFGDNSSAQLAQMAMAMSGSVAAGYTATNTIGIAR